MRQHIFLLVLHINYRQIVEYNNILLYIVTKSLNELVHSQGWHDKLDLIFFLYQNLYLFWIKFLFSFLVIGFTSMYIISTWQMQKTAVKIFIASTFLSLALYRAPYISFINTKIIIFLTVLMKHFLRYIILFILNWNMTLW